MEDTPNWGLLIGGGVALVTSVVLALKLCGGRAPAVQKPVASQASAKATAVKSDAGTGRKASDAPEDSSLTPLSIWFGSQTGTAEGFAKGLAKEAAKHGFRAKAVDLETFAPKALTGGGGLSVFIMATYGEGDPTDNAAEFTKWLKSPATPPGALDGLRFTVFGLGNRQYEHYNAMGKLVNAQLEALGGRRVYAHGEGDDEGNMEEDWENWREGGLWDALQAAAGRADGAAGKGAGASPSKAVVTAAAAAPAELPWRVVPVPAPTDARAVSVGHAMAAQALAAAAAGADVSSRHLFAAVPVRVSANTELRQAPGVGSSTRHVELDLTGTGLGYTTADNAFIVPENDEAAVKAVAAWLGYALGDWFTLESVGGGEAAVKAPFPTPCSVRTLLSRYTDLHGCPKRDLLASLAPYATKAVERQRLALLGSRDGKDEFTAWVTNAQRSVAEVLEAFPSLQLPLAAFVGLMPRQTYRAYTIASSSLVHPSSVHLCASVIDVPKPGNDGSRRLRGVCSNHLLALAKCPRPQVMMYIRPSSFHLPASPSVPVILVGPGTGLAPMRAFLHERHKQRESGASVGETVLFFGCRNRDEDFIYRDELEAFARDGTLSALHLAFSREQQSKMYVQKRIVENGQHLWKLISSDAHIYVCGATKMGHDVMKAFEGVAEIYGKMTSSSAVSFVSDLKTRKRYIQELWSS